MHDDEPTLQVGELRREYGRLVALDGLGFTLRSGECVALIGANGSGKSTAVGLISGQLTPTAGTVRVCGHDPHREPDGERARAATALVPDAPLLYQDLSVRQHLELVAIAHGVDGAETSIDGLTERLGLEPWRDRLPHELSRGMRQKTQLACSLIRPAALLVLDEPVVGLDPPSQALLHELLLERKRAGVAVLFTTHQLRFARGLADRAIVLEEGAVVDEGPWDDVYERSIARGWLAD
ncbi:MAG TPA: ABC transporter ATP-binding protein [Solirubrobacteraceae bacterium]|nr:ABC transporter ATP-binding protein [Solirubrobacteraceae bacterium]